MGKSSIFPEIPEGEVLPFVDGWDFVSVLGEGGFGEVRLVYNSQHRLKAAVKIIGLDNMTPETKRTIEREVTLHKYLKHKHVIRQYGSRYHEPLNCQFIFMEYAEGGELFDKLVPDVGMPEKEAQNYFRQLICGVQFLHSKGICHRDLKPENLLLTSDGKLKLIDFGNATVCVDRKTRQQKNNTKIVGTPPYMAPEIFAETGYKGFQVDVWAAGIILVAMLAGELPWERAVTSNTDYFAWLSNCHERSPWSRVSIEGLSFLRKILESDVEKRLLTDAIVLEPWLNKKFQDNEAYSTTCKKRRKLNTSEAYSQPVNLTESHEEISGSSDLFGTQELEFVLPQAIAQSQPLANDAIMLLASQTQSQTQNFEARNSVRIPRITRIWFDEKEVKKEVVLEAIKNQLPLFKSTEKITKKCLRFTQIGGEQRPLIFELNVFHVGEKFLLDFRRAKGCGIKFKRVFREIRNFCSKWEMKKAYTQKLVLKSRDSEVDGKENIPEEKPKNLDDNLEKVCESETC